MMTMNKAREKRARDEALSQREYLIDQIRRLGFQVDVEPNMSFRVSGYDLALLMSKLFLIPFGPHFTRDTMAAEVARINFVGVQTPLCNVWFMAP